MCSLGACTNPFPYLARAEGRHSGPPAGDTVGNSPPIPTVLSRLVLPIALVVALHLLLRGHNEPGGGFVAGLVVAIALIVQYIVAGTVWVEAHARPYPARWMAGGLLLAAATGLGALLFGYPFLTTHTAHLRLPLFGDVHVPSAMFFDFGVFATVVGATLLILTALAHQSLRSQRRGRCRRFPRGAGPPVGGDLMEIVVSIAIGVLGGAGVWLLLRPRTFQVLLGLALLSYAVNLFIFAMGACRSAPSRSSWPAWRPTSSTTPTPCRRPWC